MKFVIQKVSQASVSVEGNCVGKIQKGFLVFVGIGKEDTKEIADQYIKKWYNCEFFRMKMENKFIFDGCQGVNVLIISAVYTICEL